MSMFLSTVLQCNKNCTSYTLCFPLQLKFIDNAPMPQMNVGMQWMDTDQSAVSDLIVMPRLPLPHKSAASYLLGSLSQRHVLCTCCRVLDEMVSWSQSRLARLVVGPFWDWNCTGGRPSVHWNAAHQTAASVKTHARRYDSPSSREMILCLHWWGCVQGGCRLRCGPAGAAGKSSGASERPHGHLWYFHRPCSDLFGNNVGNTADVSLNILRCFMLFLSVFLQVLYHFSKNVSPLWHLFHISTV